MCRRLVGPQSRSILPLSGFEHRTVRPVAKSTIPTALCRLPLLMQSVCYFCQTSIKTGTHRHSSLVVKIVQCIFFKKIQPLAVELFHVDGRTRQGEKSLFATALGMRLKGPYTLQSYLFRRGFRALLPVRVKRWMSTTAELQGRTYVSTNCFISSYDGTQRFTTR